jgi:hypothetical protein
LTRHCSTAASPAPGKTIEPGFMELYAHALLVGSRKRAPHGAAFVQEKAAKVDAGAGQRGVGSAILVVMLPSSAHFVTHQGTRCENPETPTILPPQYPDIMQGSFYLKANLLRNCPVKPHVPKRHQHQASQCTIDGRRHAAHRWTWTSRRRSNDRSSPSPRAIRSVGPSRVSA